MDVTLTSSNTRVDATMMTFSLDSIRYHQLVNYMTVPHLSGTLHSWRGKPEAEVTFRCCQKRTRFRGVRSEHCSIETRLDPFVSNPPDRSSSCRTTANVHEILSNTGWTYMYHIAIRYIICYDSCPEHTQRIHIYLLHLADFYGKCRQIDHSHGSYGIECM